MGVKTDTIEASVSSGYVRAIYNGALSIGIDKARLDPLIQNNTKNLEIGTRRYPAESLLEMLELAAEHTQNPSIGILLGSQIRPERRLDVIYAASFCQNLKQAIELNIKYQPIIHTIGRTELNVNDDIGRCSWCSEFADRPGLTILKEAIFTGYTSIGRWLVWVDRLPIVKMAFRHAAPDNIELYRNIFGPNVAFGADEDVLIFKSETLDMQIPSRNAEILSRLMLKLNEKLAQIDKPENLVQDVAAIINSLIGTGPVHLQDVCEKLDMTERTLRRKLKESNTGFSEILSNIRSEAASIYMLDKKLSLAEIAQALGFNDQSAFSRAFKTWTGETPQAFRKREINLL